MKAEIFEQHRRRLFAIAYRMLGSVAEAEDVLQDAWLRAADVDVERPAGFLSTVVTRLCLDRLKSARSRREDYVGPWLPEPVVHEVTDTVELAESLSLAFLLLLERLSPAERAAFLLREVFDADYSEVAAVLEKSDTACRQLVRRARQRIDGAPRFERDDALHAQLLTAFATAVTTGDRDGLRKLLHDDVVLVSDGGGIVTAARVPIHGVDKVAKFLTNLGTDPRYSVEPVRVNGTLGGLVRFEGAIAAIYAFDILDGRIAAMQIMRNPEKMRHLS